MCKGCVRLEERIASIEAMQGKNSKVDAAAEVTRSPRPAVPNAILLKFSDQNGMELHLAVKMKAPLGKAIDRYCQLLNLQAAQARFMMDGVRIAPDDTAESLGLKNKDTIGVALEVHGSGGSGIPKAAGTLSPTAAAAAATNPVSSMPDDKRGRTEDDDLDVVMEATGAGAAAGIATKSSAEDVIPPWQEETGEQPSAACRTKLRGRLKDAEKDKEAAVLAGEQLSMHKDAIDKRIAEIELCMRMDSFTMKQEKDYLKEISELKRDRVDVQVQLEDAEQLSQAHEEQAGRWRDAMARADLQQHLAARRARVRPG